MNEWELKRELELEELRQINLKNLREQEERERQKHGTLEGNLVALVLNLTAFAISLAFIIATTILKWIFYFIIFLRTRFFLKWNWYVKTEEAVISLCATLLHTIFILPIIYLFKWWELWLVVGIVLLYYYYGK
ncbi:hypothetical protein CVU14713_08035 [Campylobacter vulpis]|uniref:hypothetical protein n=1 Tax=Campylobacter vulpis TaxID=1655500 RepID=UPI00126EC024|nr:hypothetical protein [Campylobacter vulpis]EAI8783773.1 hypothetical protein [Campylobacter upsaliensis]EAL3911377.1 hypothetical protein [Campylobacter upsaliensis]EFP6867745.1 hypothetical protein [Campylobacter upsaliensis]EKA2509239.1 hypothetical protein [Campylobacter upsaliensis]MBS4276195.1 hypothetical protein [Campylobacter vulpis]